MITITIKMASLLSDIKVKSYMNTARIKDSEDQYSVRVGEENEVEIRQSLQNAWREMLSICRKFLVLNLDPTTTTGDDELEATIATDDKELHLDFKEPMPAEVVDALAQAMHEYLVAGALRRFYTSTAMPDLVALYAPQENAARATIHELIHYRPMP